MLKLTRGIVYAVICFSSCHLTENSMTSNSSQYDLDGLAGPVIRIEEPRRNTYLETGYGPEEPTVNDAYSDAYSSEWYGTLDKLGDALARHWRRGIGDGDFFLVSELVPHRFLCVEVSK